MSKFKTGDRVRLLEVDPEDSTEGLVPGMEGTVQDETDYPFVEWDGLTTGHGGLGFALGKFDCWAVDERFLEALDAGQEPAEDVKVGGTISD